MGKAILDLERKWEPENQRADRITERQEGLTEPRQHACIDTSTTFTVLGVLVWTLEILPERRRRSGE